MIQAKKTRKTTLQTRKNSYRESLEKASVADYTWVIPLAQKIRENADVLARFISHVLAGVAASPFASDKSSFSRFDWLRGMTKLLFPQVASPLDKMEDALRQLQEGLGDLSSDFLKDTEMTGDLLVPLIETVCHTLETNPQFIVVFHDPQILGQVLGPLGERASGLIHMIPALSNHAAEKFPNLKETLFHALFNLEKQDRQLIYTLAEDVLGEVYRARVFPHLTKTLSQDPRGRVLAPILLGAIQAIPGESCINALLSIACTPHRELSHGRVIAIAIQEMGGLYIKIAQVISELCPPSLARELRTTQDDAGGIFPSIEKSWGYVLQTLGEPEFIEWKPILRLPSKPIRHFASASVGALYQIELTDEGKQKWDVESVLIKFQRPKLPALFAKQCDHILKLMDDARSTLQDDISLGGEQRLELLGLVTTLRRAVVNYYQQSKEELDFRIEEVNASKVRAALGDNTRVRVPRYFYTTQKCRTYGVCGRYKSYKNCTNKVLGS